MNSQPIDNNANLNNILLNMSSMKVVSTWGSRQVEIQAKSGDKVTVSMDTLMSSLKDLAKYKTLSDKDAGRIKGVIAEVREFESGQRNLVSMFFRNVGIGNDYSNRDMEFRSMERDRPKTLSELKQKLVDLKNEYEQLKNTDENSPGITASYGRAYALESLPKEVAELKATLKERDKPKLDHEIDLEFLRDLLSETDNELRDAKRKEAALSGAETTPGLELDTNDGNISPFGREIIKDLEKEIQTLKDKILEKEAMIKNLNEVDEI